MRPMKKMWDNCECPSTCRQWQKMGEGMGEGRESNEREGPVELRGDLSLIGPNNQANVKVNHYKCAVRQWILVGRVTQEGGSLLLQNLIRKQVRNSSIRKRVYKSTPAVRRRHKASLLSLTRGEGATISVEKKQVLPRYDPWIQLTDRFFFP